MSEIVPKIAILVPTYNNEKTLQEVLDDILKITDDVIVVNDGSTDGTRHILSGYTVIEVLHHEKNYGKGKALRNGFKRALELGYSHVVTMDSDGQHLAKDVVAFYDGIKNNPNRIIIGSRNMSVENVPEKSNFGNRFSNFWFWVNTGIKLQDTQSGFRAYPVKLIQDIKWVTSKFEFEIEVLVRSAWKGINVESIPISVYYPPEEERVSHFRTFKDFTRISVLNTVLVFLAVTIMRPLMWYRQVKKEGWKNFFKNYIYDSSESNLKIASSIALGVFIGVSPMWGYHIIIIIFLASLLKLNKAIAVVAGHISIPPMIPLIIYLSFVVGAQLPGMDYEMPWNQELSLSVIKESLLQYVCGAFLLGLMLALIVGPMAYFLLLIFRKNSADT